MRKAILILAACLIGACVWFAWSLKTRGFSARAKPGGFETFLAEHARRLVTPAGAKEMRNPLSPTPLNLAEARDQAPARCSQVGRAHHHGR